ncbi:MAG: NUDIX domain-containing protein [Burkholderiaceae bacterium]|nr:NUDIX domain-containing protein [Burkholderiaceae bacterium]
MPFVRIELAVLSVIDGSLQVLLGRRSAEPQAGRWALPGGVLRIDLDADLDAAARRVAGERLGIELPGATQLLAVGGHSRDPRAPWSLSVVYRSTVPGGLLAAEPGKRLAELKWTPTEQAAQDAELAFDHGKIVGRAVEALRAEVRVLRFAPGLLPDAFTLGELQAASEAVLGHGLDKSSFRRRIDAGAVVEAVPGQWRTGAFRPAQVFRLR